MPPARELGSRALRFPERVRPHAWRSPVLARLLLYSYYRYAAFNAFLHQIPSRSAGYYCPNTSTKIVCPKGYYCKPQSTQPWKCTLLAPCPEGTDVPRLSYMAVVIAAIVVSTCCSLAGQRGQVYYGLGGLYQPVWYCYASP